MTERQAVRRDLPERALYLNRNLFAELAAASSSW
jgi:hypothetical protein